MQYIKITFPVGDSDLREMLIAQLSDACFEGFEETETTLLAYTSETAFNEGELQSVAAKNNITYTKEIIPHENWNIQWEENFQPVIVKDFCTIRADFHTLQVTTPFEIIITPKMSFGTGHHATTQLMMEQMQNMNFKNKTVLDFGTGTGILAILAGMLGAANVLAIDNDEWSYQNAVENMERNKCERIQVQQSSLENISGEKFDIILANINRHILLRYMPDLFGQLNANGEILMSGLLEEDRDIITSAAGKAGFEPVNTAQMNGWIALLFKK